MEQLSFGGRGLCAGLRGFWGLKVYDGKFGLQGLGLSDV